MFYNVPYYSNNKLGKENNNQTNTKAKKKCLAMNETRW